jgi:hypothetical protein
MNEVLDKMKIIQSQLDAITSQLINPP